MQYKTDFNIYKFSFWSGAEDRIKDIKALGLMDELQNYIEQLFYDKIPSATDINDFVWFDCDDEFLNELKGVMEDANEEDDEEDEE